MITPLFRTLVPISSNDSLKDPEPDLVQQSRPDQLSGDRAIAVLQDVLAVLSLEPGDLLDQVAAQHLGVVPRRVGQGRRYDVLLDVVEVGRAGARVALVHGRPGGSHAVVGGAAHQQRVSCVGLLAGEGNGLLVEVRRGPRGVLDDAVEGDVGRVDELSHWILLSVGSAP
jgi:hypothetical protein